MMHTADLLKVFAEHRGDAIVISGRGGRHWTGLSDTVMDLPLGDPAMGGHSGFGLGLALAQPKRRVVLFDSEGDILMSMGQLATIAEQAPANFYHFILDNEVYATTGGQPVPNAKNVDYAMIAKGAGYPAAFNFSELGEFSAALPGILKASGPVFVALKVWPEVENTPIGQRVRWRKRSADKVVGDLRAAVGTG
jgi:thiamine pyrophosphate-dependent acetolactate synthase large subunit-like protein